MRRPTGPALIRFGAQNTPTVLVPRATATCRGPESLASTASAVSSRSVSSGSGSSFTRERTVPGPAPDAAARITAAASRSVSSPTTTTSAPSATQAAATAPNLSAGQRRRGSVAPGGMSVMSS